MHDIAFASAVADDEEEEIRGNVKTDQASIADSSAASGKAVSYLRF